MDTAEILEMLLNASADANTATALDDTRPPEDDAMKSVLNKEPRYSILEFRPLLISMSCCLKTMSFIAVERTVQTSSCLAHELTTFYILMREGSGFITFL